MRCVHELVDRTGSVYFKQVTLIGKTGILKSEYVFVYKNRNLLGIRKLIT